MAILDAVATLDSEVWLITVFKSLESGRQQ